MNKKLLNSLLFGVNSFLTLFFLVGSIYDTVGNVRMNNLGFHNLILPFFLFISLIIEIVSVRAIWEHTNIFKKLNLIQRVLYSIYLFLGIIFSLLVIALALSPQY